MNCAKCYYRNGEKVSVEHYFSCNYILYTQEPRGCEVKGCDKFLPLPQDRNANKGCGSCEFYDQIDEDLFQCRKTNEPVWSYKPSCKAFYKKKLSKEAMFVWQNEECSQKR